MNSKQPYIPGQQLTMMQQDAEKRIQFQKRIVLHQIWQSCLNCGQWSDGENKYRAEHKGLPMGCVLHKAMPPVEVVVHGCRDWEGDIPF